MAALLRLGTRGSKLALTQTGLVRDALAAALPQLAAPDAIDIVVIKTTGDAIQDRPLSEAGVNLTKIESRPSRRRAWDYVFFLDLDGHYRDAAIAPVLDQMARSCQNLLLSMAVTRPRARSRSPRTSSSAA